MKKLIFVISVFLFMFLNIQFSYSQAWVQRFAVSGISLKPSIAVDNSGNVYVTGAVDNDYATIKYNSSGFLQWYRSYNAPQNGNDYGTSIAVDNSGNVYVTGNSSGDYATIKYNSEGVSLWVQRYNGPGNNADSASALTIDNSGNVYVTGRSTGIGSQYDYATIKYNSLGDCLWVQRYNGPGNNTDQAKSIAVDNLGNVYVTGFSVGIGSQYDYATIKYDSSGAEQWVRRYNGPGNNYDDAAALAIDNSGNVYVTGRSDGSIYYDYATIKYNSSGVQQWVQRYNGPGNKDDAAAALAIDNSGNVYVTGSSVGSGSLHDYATIKYNSLGDSLWVQRYNGPLNYFDWATALAVDNSGNVYVTGHSFGDGTQSDYATIKYNSSGAQQWFHRYNGPGNNFDEAAALVLDNLGNVYVTGISGFFGSNLEYATIKFSPVQNLITGKVFFDDNKNGIQDLNEDPYIYAIISGNPLYYYAYTDYYGDYYIFCEQGTYNLFVSNAPLHYSVNPLVQSVTFTGTGLTRAGINFALIPDSVNDLRITLSSRSVRRGFNFMKDITYKNIGTTTLSGNVELLYDAHLSYQPGLTFPSPASHNPSTHTLSWNYSNLSPGETRSIHVGIYVPPGVALFTILTSTSKIFPYSGDYNPFDNVYQSYDIVTGSYDPNDKSVDLIGNITPQSVADEDSLTYTIRFQNTGTDTAIFVRVIDTLSSKLNVPTFEMLASSHEYTYAMTGAGIVTWTFDNILLPDSTTNEPKSHGFITYRIRPKNNLFIGEEIKNTANIYFDYNLPVTTNTVNTVVGNNINYIDLRCRLQAMFPVPDTLSVYLRNTASPYSIADSAKVFTGETLPEYYNMLIAFSNVLTGNSYYISINHRNSIETWSAEPVVIVGGTTVYDFTASINQAYGSNMISVDGRYSFYSGDVNQEGSIDLSDLTEVYNDNVAFASGYRSTDLNGDNIIDLSDITIVFNNAYNFVVVIKP